LPAPAVPIFPREEIASFLPDFPDIARGNNLPGARIVPRSLQVSAMLMRRTHRRCLIWVLAACVGAKPAATLLASPPQSPPNGNPRAAAGVAPGPVATLGPPMSPPGDGDPLACLIATEELLIELGGALKLGGVNNPQILLARQRVVEAVALRQLAAAQLLPSLHAGASFDDHNGNLQQSSGNILKVDRNSVYFGLGANAIAAGTVSIPGVFWAGNVSEVAYGALVARQVVEARRFASRAVENEMLRRIGDAYTELLRAEAHRAIARRVLEEARLVEDATTAFAQAGAGREADANRARSERDQREAELLEAQGQVPIASARLAELLDIPPTTLLRAVDDHVVPCQLVPEPVPLSQLLTIAILNRPELQEQRAVIRQALLSLEGARLLPFSPTVIIGLSYGGEGGGSNLVAQPVGTSPFARSEPRFGQFAERLDFDVIAFWTLENLAVGNRARVQLARSRLGTAQLQFLERLNRVRAEVANVHARANARFAQIGVAEGAVQEEMAAFSADLLAVRGGFGRPIELLQSLRLLARGRYAYLDAIVDYNEAEIDLYVALGQPPADTLARPVPLGPPPPAVPPQARGQP
jgi:outer membrane protein TolC